MQRDRTMPRVIDTYVNKTNRVIVVWVECNCDRYVLNPGDKMQISHIPWEGGWGGELVFHDDGDLQLFIDDSCASVTVNGTHVGPYEQWAPGDEGYPGLPE
ncbi:hypothetical protein [Oceanicella sp. SM1341]|uniref:hypothetical protein n=1 Tax=Oceanicella sp. SM1341 TaxID=1548889 RepID=UPI0013005F82|nr:hypothetical protein [Oceanicella sp. SM1341]